jgi:hypothetical protein
MLIQEDQVTTNEGGYIPEQMYRVRVVNTKFDMRTKPKAPMTTLDFEVIEANTPPTAKPESDDTEREAETAE